MRVETGSPGLFRTISAFLYRHVRIRLAASLSLPLLWMILVYLTSLVLLLATSFWRTDPLTTQIVQEWGLDNYRTVFLENSTYYLIALRTLVMALAVTLTDLCVAFPIAFYAARVAPPKARARILMAVAIPLWANYLIRVFAWKTLLEGAGPLDALLDALGLTNISLTGTNIAVWVTFSYLWLPFAILPIFAALERVPESYLEASSDLGARSGVTFRRVLLPLAVPGIVAGSIFTFSLTLGDYLTTRLVGKTLFLGNAIFALTGSLNDKPLAATIAVIPVVIVALYLAAVRRTGAFEAL
jgi:putative spermidine/putrescine transport system permease protein